VSASGNVDINSLMQGVSDRVTGQYYYTLKLAAGTVLQAQYNLFSAALAEVDPYPLATIIGPAPMLSKVETNIPTRASAGLPPPYDIVIDSIGLFIQPSTIKADVDILIQYSYFEFAILGKVQWDGKLESYPAGMGLSGFSTQTTESGWQLGLPSPNEKKRFGKYGKYLAPQLQWSFTLFFPPTSGPITAPATVPGAAQLTASSATPTDGVGTMIRAYLFGLIDRPVL
jgi:hypothetical protein